MFRLAGLWFAGALFIASITPSSGLAQSNENSWAEPLNLSHSGVAMDPAIVTDSEGIIHVVWQDDLANYMYTRLEGEQWSVTETTDLDRLFRLPPASESQLAIYTGPNPLLIAGPDRNVFAFWISAEGDLFRSKVNSQSFEDVAAWDSGRRIAAEAVSFAAAIDAQGELHLAYFRMADDPDNPSGVYYTRSRNRGTSWSIPVLLYESSYLRRLGEGEANLSVATAGTEDALRVYVAWDNRPRKQVHLAQSADGGESWEQPVLIAGPAPNSGSASPFNIHVGAIQNNVVLVWQTGQPGSVCNQIYQSSRDAGATWNDPQPMIEGLLGCTQPNEFVKDLANSPEGPLYFLTATKSQFFLTAWNGSQWSQPQAQPFLLGFEEPEIYTDVIYGCQRASLVGKRLYVIGCDEGVGGDVWVTSRDLESDSSWFEPPVWNQFSPMTGDNLEIEAVELIATDDGLIHAVFDQHQKQAIYYAYWDGEFWSRITPVLELPEGEAGTPAIAAGEGNELFLIAPNNRGALYFSRGTSGNTAAKSRWSTPTHLANSHDGEIGSVDVAWDASGTINVAYSVPVNEERGIYLVQSKDHGTSWSEPLQVFDGAAAGFDLVGAPSMQLSENGFLHIIWKQQSIQGDGAPQPLSLYYSRSDDGGRTFSNAELLVEEPVTWHQIVADGSGNVHLLWQDTKKTVWDQVSFDNGKSWQFPQGLPGEGMAAAIMEDPASRLHVVNAGPGFLGHWLWDGSRWQPEAPLHWSFPSQQEGRAELLAAAVTRQGEVVVVLAGLTSSGDADTMERFLLFTTRTLEIPETENAIQETPTRPLAQATLAPVTAAPELSPTQATVVESEPTASQDQTNRDEPNTRISPLTMALLPVALLLLSVLGIVLRRVVQAKDQ